MRALRRREQEPGPAQARRKLVHRYLGDEAPAPPSATEELSADRAVEEVSLRRTVVTDVVVNDGETPSDSSSAPRGDVEVDTPRAVLPESPFPPPVTAPDLLETLRRSDGP